MKLRRSVAPTDANAPGRLAEEFGRAQSEFEARRANIIERGVTRQREITALMDELQTERLALADVVRTAETA
jgi:hypothetical protein